MSPGLGVAPHSGVNQLMVVTVGDQLPISDLTRSSKCLLLPLVHFIREMQHETEVSCYGNWEFNIAQTVSLSLDDAYGWLFVTNQEHRDDDYEAASQRSL